MIEKDATNKAFREWRKRNRYTQQEASKVLGISAATVKIYEYGIRHDPPRGVFVPLVVRLACMSVERGLGPIE